jgi:flagellum-specific ATP synthase
MTTLFQRPDWHVALRGTATVRVTGRITRVRGQHVEADGPSLPTGAMVRLGKALMAQVSAVSREGIVLAPFGDVEGVRVGDVVEALAEGAFAMTGDDVLGRAMDALGQPLDGGGPVDASIHWPLAGRPAPALERITPSVPLETGIRAIDALLTLGRGQRVGIFAGSGVGKSTLLAALCRQVDADALVLCLVGERGREAHDFWHQALDEQTRTRATLVVSTSDEPAIKRARSVDLALAHAEYLRAQGKHVVLLVDSMTRYAYALREIGLAAGEPPALRSFTPGVFAALPRVVERCGALASGGAITAIMTVLTESDDVDDPMAEVMRSLLDGHIVLSRVLAERAHYPAIDVPRSISRVFRQVNDSHADAMAREAVAQLSLYEGSRTLVESGLYATGTQPALDHALARREQLLAFLRQAPDNRVAVDDTRKALAAVLGVAA